MDLSSEKVFADEKGSNTFTEAGNKKQVTSSSNVTPDGEEQKKKAGNSNQVKITLISISEEQKINLQRCIKTHCEKVRKLAIFFENLEQF